MDININKGQMAELIAKRLDLPISVGKDVVTLFSDIIVNTVSRGGRVSLIGFGTFWPQLRAARHARNPQTNVPMIIQERYIAKFTPGKRFREQLKATLKTESTKYD